MQAEFRRINSFSSTPKCSISHQLRKLPLEGGNQSAQLCSSSKAPTLQSVYEAGHTASESSKPAFHTLPWSADHRLSSSSVV